jgi:hypothetical protein
MIDFKKIKPTTIVFIGAIILMLLLIRQCNRSEELKEQLKVEHQNLLASNDSIRIVKNRLGEEISIKNVYITEKKDLESLNKNLAKELDKTVGKVLFLQSTIAQLGSTQVDTNTPEIIQTEITKYPGGENVIDWSKDTVYSEGNSRTLAGKTTVKFDTITGEIVSAMTQLEKDLIRFKITTGLTELDDSYQIFVKSDYPGFEFTDIEGAILDKDRFLRKENESTVVFGPYVGYGLGYNHVSNQFGPTVSFGLALTYNVNKPIKKWFRKIKKF